MNPGDTVEIKHLIYFDSRAGLRLGDRAEVISVTPNIVEVKFKEWRDPEAPLFHEGQRMMLAQCLEVI